MNEMSRRHALIGGTTLAAAAALVTPGRAAGAAAPVPAIDPRHAFFDDVVRALPRDQQRRS